MNVPAHASGVVRLGERKPAVMAEIHLRVATSAARRDMTAVCGTCGTVYWTAKGHRCSRRRSCDHLPRSRYARLTAQVAALRAELGAIDRGLIEAGITGSRALARADAVGSHVEALSEAVAAAHVISGRDIPRGLALPARRDRIAASGLSVVQ
jgi:hypothetical protein